MFFEIIKFLIYSALIVLISKYILVKTLRNLAESLNLKPKTIGEIAGYATSIPEFLTITISSFSGLIGASIYNVISSNIINFIQYIWAIIANKNVAKLQNMAMRIDLIMVLFTIFIPIFLISVGIETSVSIVPIFILLYVFFKFINNNIHKLYLKYEDELLENKITYETKRSKKGIEQIIFNILILLLVGIALYFIGNKLGVVLENLCERFGVKEFIIGILLGFITSIPELITFFESQKHYKANDNSMSGVTEATNNLLISNILNLFIIQSIGILIFAVVNSWNKMYNFVKEIYTNYIKIIIQKTKKAISLDFIWKMV